MEINFGSIIEQYKDDKESVYNTWFINNEERLKACNASREKILLAKK